MTTYAIGDLQGCYTALQQLLEKIHFDPEKDMLWFAGDLVNRGPESLQCLRFVKSLGDRAITVLGNHDLHLLAIAEEHKSTNDQGLKDILDADDSEELLDWLRQQPLLHHDPVLGYTLVHAGIYPLWDLQQAQEHARELEAVLQSEQYRDFIFNMYGNEPDKWQDDLTGFDRLRFICNSFTRMRYCNEEGVLDFSNNGAPGTAPENMSPWFTLAARKTKSDRVVFGHWSTLGLVKKENIFALDTGCVWGGKLTALALEATPAQHFSIDCTAAANPADFVKK